MATIYKVLPTRRPIECYDKDAYEVKHDVGVFS